MAEAEDAWKQKLTINFVFLLENMECDVMLLGRLLEAKVLTKLKKRELQIKLERHDRNDAFIEYMETRPENDYYKFLRALIESGQGHVAVRVEGNAVMEWKLNPQYPHNSSEPFLAQPKINAISPADIETTIGETVYIKANVTGIPEPEIVWSEDGTDIVSVRAKMAQTTTQSGAYCLKARNEVGTDGATVTLAVKEIGLKFEENTKAAAIAFKKHLGLGSNNSIIVTGGCDFPNAKSDVFLLEQESNNSIKCIPLPQFALKTARRWHESALINGCIVTFGGIDQREQILSSAECIDLNAMTTKSIASMITPRYEFSCGVIGDKVFACGGWNMQSGALDLCEYYDIINDRWLDFSSMKYKRYNSSGDVLNGILYVTGGKDRMGDRSVEAYDPVVDKWTLCPSLKKGRWLHGCATLEGAIYVAGGGDGMPECERYDPRMSEWVECANMKQRRRGHVLVAADDKLYAIGGLDWNGDTLASVEMYDPRNNEWEIMENVIEPLWCMSAVVL